MMGAERLSKGRVALHCKFDMQREGCLACALGKPCNLLVQPANHSPHQHWDKAEKVFAQPCDDFDAACTTLRAHQLNPAGQLILR